MDGSRSTTGSSPLTALYEDDTAISIRSTHPAMVTRRLQEALDRLNAEKTQVVFFRKNRKRAEDNVDTAGEEINWTSKAITWETS